MSNLQIFNYEENSIRTIIENETFWWVAKDVCEYFGDSDHKRSISRLDENDRKLFPVIDSLGREQKTTCINESGLYALLFNFQPEKARGDEGAQIAPQIKERIEKIQKFKKWVTSEVLPSIRKTGKYDVTQKSDDELILIGYEKLMEKVKQLTPKAESHDRYLSAENAEEMAVVAQKLYGDKIGRNKLFKTLREKGILKPDNTPYQDYMQYFKVVTKPQTMGDKVVNIPVTLVKPEGVDFIMRRVNA